MQRLYSLPGWTALFALLAFSFGCDSQGPVGPQSDSSFEGTSRTAQSGSSVWTAVEVETDNDLYDVERTSAGQYAVGGNGVLLKRTVENGTVNWKKIVDGGPSGNGKNLYGSDVTAERDALWFVGASGAVGEYDVESGVIEDHSGPDDTGDNFNDIAVTGQADEANVYGATDSGLIFYSFEDGESGTWNYVTPGSGSSIQAIDFHAAKAGHAVDTNGKVFATDDGVTWTAIGLQDANVNFYAVDSDAANDVWVAGGNGMVFHWDGNQWTRTDLGDANLRDVEVEDGEGYAVGTGGQVFHYDGTWRAQDTPTGQNLNAIVQGAPTSAVGASGTALER
ncbi:MAG: hypothetical protein ABEL04_04490 [Salinibacter sp.]|uniref:hypothetical protein n=1 Tax=Salinibacter sp. TaxID=2065818 RepID=UPI0035D48FB8